MIDNRAYLRARYADRKARGVCVDCQAPSDGSVRCLDCREAGRLARSRYDREHPEVARARAKRVYAKHGDLIRERNRERRLAKKLRGECEKCPEPALPDSAHCAKHRELTLARKRDYNTRKRDGGPLKVGGVKPGFVRIAYCECGAEKPRGSDSCPRCTHLDGIGRRDRAGDVIDALRGSDGMSLRELCEALGMNADIKNGQRQMRRWVESLLEQGRLRRYWREDSTTDSERVSSYRDGAGERQSAIGCWAYALDGKTEREWMTAFVVRWMAWALCWRASNETEERRAA